MIGNNLHNRAERDLIEKQSDIVRSHSNAAVAGGTANGPLFGCAVDVNTTSKSVRVFSFETTQPKDAGNDRIPPRRVGGQNFTGPAAIVEDGAIRRVIANFLDHLQK